MVGGPCLSSKSKSGTYVKLQRLMKYTLKAYNKYGRKNVTANKNQRHTFNVTFQRTCFTLYFQYSWLTRIYWREKTTKARTKSFSSPVSTSCMVNSSTARHNLQIRMQNAQYKHPYMTKNDKFKKRKRNKKSFFVFIT